MRLTAIWIQVLEGLWLTLPAYLPNSAAAFFGGGKPIDGGRSFRDGRRILGDGKTWRGTLFGTASGIALGIIQIGLLLGLGELQDKEFQDYFGTFPSFLLIIFLLAFGALLGDMSASFFKRRRNVARGAKAPGLDQYDFLLGAWLLVIVVGYPTGWFSDWFIDDGPWRLLTVLIVTPFLHRAVNIIGYKIGKKEVPW